MSFYNFPYQKASFRGAQFAVFDADVLFGRRNVLHEYPLRDEPFAEDLGKKAREYTINAFVIGQNLRGARDALIRAIEDNENPGTLVHPTLGSIVVIPKDCRVRYDSREGGIEFFTLTFIEAGSRSTPSTSANTRYLSRQSSNNAIQTFISSFANRYVVSGFPDFLKTNATNKLIGTPSSTASGAGDDFVSTIRSLFAKGSFGSDNLPFAELVNTLSKFPSKLDGYIAEPSLLAQSISSILSSVTSVFLDQDVTNDFVSSVKPNNPAQMALEAQRRLMSFGSLFELSEVLTESRTQDNTNIQQLVSLVVNISLAQMVTIVSQTEFPSRQDAINVRDTVDNHLLNQITILADRAEDASYNSLTEVRAAMIKDVNTRAASLKNKKYIRINDSLPAIVFAYDQYEDATKDAEIVSRNRVRNPVFIPPQTSVEVLV